jgi:hypothetical protein
MGMDLLTPGAADRRTRPCRFTLSGRFLAGDVLEAEGLSVG